MALWVKMIAAITQIRIMVKRKRTANGKMSVVKMSREEKANNYCTTMMMIMIMITKTMMNKEMITMKKEVILP